MENGKQLEKHSGDRLALGSALVPSEVLNLPHCSFALLGTILGEVRKEDTLAVGWVATFNWLKYVRFGLGTGGGQVLLWEDKIGKELWEFCPCFSHRFGTNLACALPVVVQRSGLDILKIAIRAGPKSCVHKELRK